MRRIAWVMVFASLLLTAGAARASVFCHTLTGRIYDLSSSHPNMELPVSGLEPGIVLPELGDDGQPQFNPTTTAVSVTNASDFFDWYHDTPANLSTSFLIDMLETSPGVYSFSSPEFFPIDEMLLGNEGNPHNYHFTAALSTTIAYTPGQYFSATSDDDLWVFIGGDLALDLGGVHAATSGTIDLDTLGLEPGAQYQLAIFFAERHTTGSELHLETNIRCVPEPTALGLGIAGLVATAAVAYARRRVA